MADVPVNWHQNKIGELAYKTEVKEFNEPGGMMDQYTTAMGELIYLQSEPDIRIRSVKAKLGNFVLGDSNEQKDTLNILLRCRDTHREILKKLQQKNIKLDLHYCKDEIDLSDLSTNEKILFKRTIPNRDLVQEAINELKKNELDHNNIGRLLSEHHGVLRDVLQLSTPKIEIMLEASLTAGTLGGKINASVVAVCLHTAQETPKRWP